MRMRLALSLATVALLALALSASANATVTVANQNDSGAGSLRETIAEAPPGETIRLPAGTYTLTSGPLLVSGKSFILAGHGAGDTTIRAEGAFRVVDLVGPLEAEIRDVTIRNGHPTGGIVEGGGVHMQNANLTLRRSTVTGNTADARGSAGNPGGIANGGGVSATGGTLTLIETTIAGNLATANGGSGKNGGIVQGGGLFSTSVVHLMDSALSGNTAEALGGQGPASSEQNGGIAQGGGFFSVNSEANSAATVNSTVSGNLTDVSAGPGASAGIGQGGGVYAVDNSGPITFKNSTLAGNTVRGFGNGGILQGGGAFASGNSSVPMLFLGVTVAANKIEGPGLTFGGDLDLSGKVSLRNSIVTGGSGAAGSENCYLGSVPTPSLGFNLDSLNQCGFSAAGDQVNKDPLLGPLQGNGGPTQTMVPAPSSPAVDQGISIGDADQRGVVRPIDFPSIANAPGGDGADIGAVELQPASGLTLGKLTRNKKNGTGTITVALPTPSAGTLSFSGRGLKGQTVAITGQGEVTFEIATVGGVSKSLRKKGKVKVEFEVIYSPTGNSPATAKGSTTLVRKKHHHKRRHHHKRHHHHKR